MKYDIFFSLSHTRVGDALPTEAQMFLFFDQVIAADELGLRHGLAGRSPSVE